MPTTGLECSAAETSQRMSGSANSKFSVHSRSTRTVRAWLSPPSTRVRALVK
jgi:hypothetical protein